MIFFSVCAVLIIELLILPFPTYAITVPEIYYEIAKDPDFFVILEAPMGGNGDLRLGGNQMFLFYQFIHEKPLLSGGTARMPPDVQREIQTNFLNKFIGVRDIFLGLNQSSGIALPWEQDIIRQDLHQVGTSLFNFHDIGWVILHKERSDIVLKMRILPGFVPQTTELLENILNKKPDYEDEQVIAFKIPNSTSNFPFMVLDNGWSPIKKETRSIGHEATLIIVNPQSQSLTKNIELEMSGYKNQRTIELEYNNKKITHTIIPNEWKTAVIKIDLIPGKNYIKIKSDSFDYDEPLSSFEPPLKKSIIFKKISLVG